MAGRIRAKAQDLFALDERSLAVCRIGLGLLLIADLVTRVGELRAHYTDLGIMPRVSLAMGSTPSVHFLSGQPAFQGALFSWPPWPRQPSPWATTPGSRCSCPGTW